MTAQAPGFPSEGPWLRAVMAATLDGAVRGPDGRSGSISSAADQRWFSDLRRDPDVLIVGAGTVRDEDYAPPRALAAIVSARLDLPGDLRILQGDYPVERRPLVFTTDASARRPPEHLPAVVEIIPCGEASVDLTRMRSILLDRGLARMQCEGGPRLLAGVVAADLLDELLLSITPLLHGAPGADHLTFLPGGFEPFPRLRVESLQEEDGTVFLRLLRC